MEKASCELFQSIGDLKNIRPLEAENLFSSLAEAVITNSLKLPHTFPSESRKGKPEWNAHVSEAYDIAKEARKAWLLPCSDNDD